MKSVILESRSYIKACEFLTLGVCQISRKSGKAFNSLFLILYFKVIKTLLNILSANDVQTLMEY